MVIQKQVWFGKEVILYHYNGQTNNYGLSLEAPSPFIEGGTGTPSIIRDIIIPPRLDPLALDLDNDGIETVGTESGILFDHNADGIKTGTGWLQADDGWLVLDRNGNGIIDSGQELFGVDTVLANGTTASDGFNALKQQDSNNDGVISVADTVFNQLKIWQDLNQINKLRVLANYRLAA